MSDPIPPALTAEEWIERQTTGEHEPLSVFQRCYPGDESGRALIENGDLHISYDGAVVSQRVPNDELPKIITIANAVLPEDSPHKITHQKIEALERLIDDLKVELQVIDFYSSHREKAVKEVTELLNTLLSLLPPGGNGQ